LNENQSFTDEFFLYLVKAALAGRKTSSRLLDTGTIDSPAEDSDSDGLLSESCNDGENPAFLHGTNWLTGLDSIDIVADFCRKANEVKSSCDSCMAE
jgi:hypothetical protein